MCTGALIWARISEIIFGAYDKKAGACGSVFNIADNKKLNHRIKITGGIQENECRTMMQAFFKKRRE
jgi:tRNA(adenine34) deaminase